MAAELRVKSQDEITRSNREALCSQVLGHFHLETPGTKLLCFVDDIDCTELKNLVGQANRGIFVPQFYRSAMANHPPLPDYVKSIWFESQILTGLGHTN
jgi:hypothetical protein